MVGASRYLNSIQEYDLRLFHELEKVTFPFRLPFICVKCGVDFLVVQGTFNH